MVSTVPGKKWQAEVTARVSVLVCTYKRNDLLDRCLRALITGAHEKPDEIVIVDGDEGKAAEIISRWRDKFPNIKFIPTKNINLATARNIGLPHCTGDIIALTDDDVQVTGDWVGKICQLHKDHPEAGAIGGKIRGADNSFLDKVANRIIFPCQDNPAYVRTIPGANASYKREVIEKIGAYDESLFRGEDVDYNWRIVRTGSRVYYTPDLHVYHHHRNTWAGLFSQIFMYGRAYYLVRKKWKEMYCVYPHNLKTPYAFAKAVYFLLGAFLNAFFQTKYIAKKREKVIAYPIFVLCDLIWRYGMVWQSLKNRS